MTPSSPTELELVRGLHARDRKAFARVYGDYHAAVYNLCARILGDREEAKDVTQDVFLKAFDRPPAAEADVRLRPWLYRVATNACLNLVRTRRPGGPVEVEALPAAIDTYEQARSAELIERSLAGMNERYRAALVLKDLHGLRGGELAEVLAISRPAADVLVHRARASFKVVFAGLAGEGTVAPANLALALPTLAVPAALQALPMPSATPPFAPHGPAASGAGPVAGILAKITAALGTKAALVAAGAVVAAGGGIAAVKLADRDAPPAPASPGGGAAQVTSGSAGGHHGAGHGPLDGWAEHRRVIADHLGDAHHGHHAGSGHDGAGHGAAHDGAAHDQAGHTASTSHDSTTHDATDAASSSTSSSTTTGGHDGDDAGHDGADH